MGNALFVDDGQGDVSWLLNTASTFGWLGSVSGLIEWRKAIGCVSREEVFHELQRTSKGYSAVETLPHFPELPGHYYACKAVTPGEGDYARKLIDRFSPATPLDWELIVAAMATLFWGGAGGCRPCFVITSSSGRGAGKSKLTEMISLLVGGAMLFGSKDDPAEIKQRLLTISATPTRMAILDNLKTLKFSWAEFEALLTAPTISGKRMYVGEASRPNTLTWFVTLNGASLSTDMAQRAVFIKLNQPTRTGEWEDETKELILTHRWEIIADLIGFLMEKPTKRLEKFSRWAAWENAILSRLSDPDAAQRLILERQAEVDADADEALDLEHYFAEKLVRLGYDIEREKVHIPSDIGTQWFNAQQNERLKSGQVTTIIKQFHAEGRMKNLRVDPGRANGRGFLWQGENSLGASKDITLRDKIEEKERSYL